MASLRLLDVVRQHGPAYLERFSGSILPSHAAALAAIANCRTAKLGGHMGQCSHCGAEHVLLNSCRHRACPQCGHSQAERWLARQQERLLPVAYFHVVFTLPAELRRVVRAHQKLLIGAMFGATFESLALLAKDPRFLGAAQIGALAVLHTWTRTLEWHPHIHMLVPAGGLAEDGRTWLEPKEREKPFLVPVHALSDVFRATFAKRARKAVPGVVLAQRAFDKRWVTFSKPVVQGPESVLQYLGRYVYRTALSDKAIVHVDETSVTFRYRRSQDHTRRTMRLDAHEFLRRFLQHVPPRGFHRVRSFGLLHPSRRNTLGRLQLLLTRPPHATQHGDVGDPTPQTAPPSPKLRCPHCHQATLQLVQRLTPAECEILLATTPPSLPAADKAPTPKGSSP